MKKLITLTLVFISGAAQAELIDRGEGFIYDDVLDITWTQSANINGLGSWTPQVAWVDGYSQTHSVYGTFYDWRLASMDVNGDDTIVNCESATEAQCQDNEYGYLYYQYGITTSSPGPFTNLSAGYHWSGTEYVVDADIAWTFYFDDYPYNRNSINVKHDSALFAWAVRDGDVGSGPYGVSIDISPNDDTNAVKTDGNFSDKMFVSVEGSAYFDATQVDASTIRFGPAVASPLIVPGTVVDTNDDGIDDMRLKFRIVDTGLTCEYPDDVTLTGETNGGLIQFEGTDSVTTEPCPITSCHP